MYEIVVIKEGYSVSEGPGHQKACGSITLVKGPHNIIVDTGNPWDRDLIVEGLQHFDLSPGAVEFVICTNGHPDKVGNLNLFTKAKQIVAGELCFRDDFFRHAFKQGIPYEIDDDVEVVPTPGHTGSDVSVLVRNTALGTVAITGDLFECFEDLENPNLWQDNSENPDIQEQGRIQILQLADHIVPGHGKQFKVPDEYKQQMKVVMFYEEQVLHRLGDQTTSSTISEYLVVEDDD